MTKLRDWIPHNLYLRVLLAMIACITVVLAGSTAIATSQAQQRLASDLLAKGQNQTEVLTSATNVFVAQRDTGQLTLIAAAATARSEVQYVAFYDLQGTLLAAATAPSAALDTRTSFADLRAQVQASGIRAVRWSEEYLDVAAPITWIGQRVGVVGVRLAAGNLAGARRQALSQGAITALTLLVLLSVAIGLLLRQFVIVPLRRLSAASEQISRGVWTVPVGQDRRDELGQVARSFAQMVAALRSREDQLQEQITVVQELNAALDTKIVERTAELHQLVGAQDRLLNQIHQMSIPVVPVLEGLIIIPLIGSLDSARTVRLIHNVLTGVEQHRAHSVVLDITGVPVVDAQVASVLVQVAQATRLLGATMVLVGIRPEVAETLVQIEADLSAMQTFATLQDALRVALAHEHSAQQPT